ncbi:MAG TPA: Ivy family c-type lysozyme inhibitor [Drouetiella sp.]
MKSFAVLGLISMFTAASPAVFAAENYPFEIKKANRPALRAYQKIVPPKYMAMPWIYTLEGTSPPMSVTKFNGKDYYYGSVCMPHNCGGNDVVFLIAKDGSSAFGLLRSEDLTKGKEVEFGAHNDAAKKLLEKQLSN